MTLRRFFFLLLVASVVAWFPVAVWAGVASAQISGGCLSTIAGKDAGKASTPQTAIDVDYNSVVKVTGTAPGHVVAHHIQLEFFGKRWTVSSGIDNGNTWSGTVNVPKYAKKGVGYYKVIGLTVGPGACTGFAYVNVTGKNPLTTLAGGGAAGATAVAVVGLGYATAVAARPKKTPMEGVSEAADRAQAAAAPTTQIDEAAYMKALDDMAYLLNKMFGIVVPCVTAFPGAMISTIAYMVSGAGVPGAPGGPAGRRMLPRAHWRPKIALGALAFGLLGGIGAMVLLQQFAVFYPTRTVAILEVAGGLLAGIVLPSLGRWIAVRRVNRFIAGVEQRLSGQGASA